MKRKVNRKRQSLKQKFGYQEGGNVVDPKGYLDSNRDSYSPYKVIPSNEITMNGVSENVMAFPFTNEGQALGEQMMRPGEEFKFDGADYVVEVPEAELEKFMSGGYLDQYKKGGYKKWQPGGGVGLAAMQALEQTRDEAQKSLEDKNQEDLNQFQADFNEDTLETATARKEGRIDDGSVDLFNPYGGFDIPTAAFTLGQGIEEGNAGKIAASGAKFLAGSARNFMSGLAGQRRNQFVTDEYNQNQKNDLTRTETLQDGGQLSTEDVEAINSGLEFQFSEDAANSLFERVDPKARMERPPLEEPNLGAYKDLGYFDVSRNGDEVILSSTSRNPHNAATLKPIARKLKEMNPGMNMKVNYLPKNQDGGNLTTQDVDNINSGLEFQFSEDAANSLFERVGDAPKPPTQYQPDLGKYGEVGYFDVEDVQGDVITLNTTSKNPHNASSVKGLIPQLRSLNPGKEIRVNYVPKMEEGGKLKRSLTDGYIHEIENENFMQPNAEVEDGEYISGQGEPVKEVIGETHENGGVDVKLEEEDKILSDHLKLGKTSAKHARDVYGVKVKATDTYSTVLDKFKKKSGLEKIYKEKESIITKIEKQENIEDESTGGLNLQFLSGKLNELDEKQQGLEQEMKFVFEDMFGLQESSKPKSTSTKSAMAREENEDMEEFELGGTQMNGDQIIALGKKFNIAPDEAIELFKEFKNGGHMSYEEGGLPMYQDAGTFGNKGQGLGFVPEGQSQQDTGLYGGVDEELFLDTRTRNPWFDWRNFDPNSREDVLRFQQQFNRMSTDGQQIREDGKFGEQTQSVQLDFTDIQPVVLEPGEISMGQLPIRQYVEPSPEAKVEIEKDKKKRARGNRMDAILLPDQYPMSPDAMQPHLKAQRRFDRLDPNLISPEQQIEEINRNTNQVEKQLNNLPDSQRRAALASLNANANNQINQAISQTNKVNSQIKTDTDRINLQQSNMEENFLATDALDFERRQLTAMAKTQNDIRNYFNQLRRVQVGNFNTINDLNLINDMNSDFQFTSTGVEKTTKNPEFTSDPARIAMLKRQGILSDMSATPTKKKATAKYGGKMKKRRVRKKK